MGRISGWIVSLISRWQWDLWYSGWWLAKAWERDIATVACAGSFAIDRSVWGTAMLIAPLVPRPRPHCLGQNCEWDTTVWPLNQDSVLTSIMDYAVSATNKHMHHRLRANGLEHDRYLLWNPAWIRSWFQPETRSKSIYHLHTNLINVFLENLDISILLGGKLTSRSQTHSFWEKIPRQAQPPRGFASHQYSVKWVHGLWVHTFGKAYANIRPSFLLKLGIPPHHKWNNHSPWQRKEFTNLVRKD